MSRICRFGEGVYARWVKRSRCVGSAEMDECAWHVTCSRNSGHRLFTARRENGGQSGLACSTNSPATPFWNQKLTLHVLKKNSVCKTTTKLIWWRIGYILKNEKGPKTSEIGLSSKKVGFSNFTIYCKII